MAQDVFKRTVSAFGGSYAADSARLRFTQTDSAGLLVQQINFSYVQNVNRIYDLADNKVYYIGGRTAGQGSLAHVVGPRVLLAKFYELYGDVCNAKSNHCTFEMSRGCEGAAFSSMLKYCVLQQIAISTNANDMLVNEQSALMFSSMSYEENGGSGVAGQAFATGVNASGQGLNTGVGTVGGNLGN